jgi:hypothetical protein
MSQGAPKIRFTERTLGEAIPSYKGTTGVIIMDCEKGDVNTPIFVSSEGQLVEKTGKPNPKKYGIGYYSASNFLKESSSLWIIRVDKDQKYASALVRATINPVSEYDEFGYVLDKPSVDPIVKPNGQMSKLELDGYEFIQYPNTRKVDEYAPVISLIDKPETGDNILYINNSAPVSVGDVITLKDTTGMTREDSLAYKTYTVLRKGVIPVRFDYVTVAEPLTGISINTRLQKVDTYDIDSVSRTATHTAAGSSRIYIDQVDPTLPVNSDITIGMSGQVRKIVSYGNGWVDEDFVTPITGTAVAGTSIIQTNDASQLSNGDSILFEGTHYEVVSISGANVTVNMPIVGRFSVTPVTASGAGSKHTAVLSITDSAVTDLTLVVQDQADNSVVTYVPDLSSATTVDDKLAELASTINSQSGTLLSAQVTGQTIVLESLTNTTLVLTIPTGTQKLSETAGVAPVKQVAEISPTVVDGVTHQFRLTINGSNTVVYTGAPANVAQFSTEFSQAINTFTPQLPVVASVGVNDELIITARVAGTPFTTRIDLAGSVQESQQYDYMTVDVPVSSAIPSSSIVKHRSVQVADYSSLVLTREVLAGSNNKVLRVSNNDPIAEGDVFSVNGTRFTVLSKHTTVNNIHSIELDAEYLDQTVARIGDSVFKVALGDWVQRDALLVYSASPGEWGNRTAITIRDSRDYASAFWVDVYYDGVQVESWEVTQEYMKDGYGRQMNIDEKINNQSQYIRVKTNELLVDEDGKYVEPMKTLYYVAQPIKQINYTEIGQTAETVWDTDNLIRIRQEDILNVDVNKPVKIGDSIYNIARIDRSAVGGPYDTLVLETGVSLGMEDLLPMDRKLPVGTPIKQYINRARKEELTVTQSVEGYEVVVKVRNTTTVQDERRYSYVVTASDTVETVASAVAALLTPDRRINASAVGNVITVVSQEEGIDFELELPPDNTLTSVVVQTVARQYTNFPTTKVTGSILPTVIIGSEVDLSNGRYTILDAGANRLSGGDDNGYPTLGQYLIAADQLVESNRLDFLVAMDGGITIPTFQRRLAEICEKRMDSVAFLSIDYNAQFSVESASGTLAYRRNANINSSYAAMYTPWVKVYDKYNDIPVWASPESWAGRSAGYVSNNGELWYALAGNDNAKVLGDQLAKVYNDGELDLLYDNQLNPIRFITNVGMNIGGQKTLLAAAGPTSRINVRLVVIVILRGLREYFNRNDFKFNNEATRSKYETEGRAFLQDIKIRGGLYDYAVYCNTKNNTQQIIDNNELIVDIGIQPTKVGEFITNRITITNTGANLTTIIN